ncbi:MAG: HAMP domain-containing sensor histidine kinase [Candidatus Ozemobacteraceae bacterium]
MTSFISRLRGVSFRFLLPQSIFGRLFLSMSLLSFGLVFAGGAYFASQAYGILNREANNRLLSGARMIAAEVARYSGNDPRGFFEELFEATFGAGQGMGWLCHVYWADLQGPVPVFKALISLPASDSAPLAAPTPEDLEDLLDEVSPDLEAGKPAFPDPTSSDGQRRYKIVLVPILDADHLLTHVIGLEADMLYLDLTVWLRSTLWRAGLAALLTSIMASLLLARGISRRIGILLSDLEKTAARETLPDATLGIREFDLLRQGLIRLGETIRAGDHRLRETTDAKMAELSLTGAAIAHEVRNPLAAVELHLGLIRRRFCPSDDDLESFHEIEDGIDRMKRLTDRFLSYSKRVTPNFVALDPALWFNEWFADRKRLGAVFQASFSFREFSTSPDHLSRKGLETQIACPSSPPLRLLFIDPEMWRQISDIFLDNALLARPEGLEINVWIEHVPETPDCMRIVFADNGPGVSAEMEGQLFTPFSSGRRDGHGIGLALVRKLVEAHHGIVFFRRPALGGAEFVVEVPEHP